MKTYVGVTDGEWYHQLAARPAGAEVNFWRPAGARRFHAINPGEPFFFKTHHPHNRVVGGGIYNGFEALHVSEAWDMFASDNGAHTLDEMRTRIARYRRQPLAPHEDPVVGCILIRDVRFFSAEAVAEPPPDFAPNIVQGKSYDLADGRWSRYFGDLLSRVLDSRVETDLAQPWRLDGPVYGDPRLSPRRLGQRAFQAVVHGAYDRRCAITGDRIRPVLQAAHILPLPQGGEHRTDNGLLLRSDVHTLFDRGYLGVDTRHRLLVSPRLRDEFCAGDQFYGRAGQTIGLPERSFDRPNEQFLEWHLENAFLSS